MQDVTRDILDLRFGATYIRGLGYIDHITVDYQRKGIVSFLTPILALFHKLKGFTWYVLLIDFFALINELFS